LSAIAEFLVRYYPRQRGDYNYNNNICYCYYLRQRGYVFTLIFVLFLVSSITQKLLNQFSKSSVERWHMGQGRNDWILMVIRITLF